VYLYRYNDNQKFTIRKFLVIKLLYLNNAGSRRD
jgi:hypothetical protein